MIIKLLLVNYGGTMHLRRILILLMALHTGFVLALFLSVISVIDSQFLLMIVKNGRVEPLSYMLLSILMLMAALTSGEQWSKKAMLSVLFVLGSVVGVMLVTYPYLDVNVVTCSLLVMLVVREKLDLVAGKMKSQGKKDVVGDYMFLSGQLLCVAVILCSVFNFVKYYFFGTVAFTVNTNLYLLLVESIYLLYVLRRLMLTGSSIPKPLYILPLLIMPFVFIDIKRSLSLDGIYVVSLMMLLTTLAITHHARAVKTLVVRKLMGAKARYLKHQSFLLNR